MQTMERLPNSVFEPFMKGEHVVHLRRGFWNEIWSNLSIEPTYMKTAKGPAGLIEQTTYSRSVTVWTNSHHLCSKKLTELESLMNRDKKLRKQA